MAQGTGAERLIAPRARAAGARGILALAAAAALVLPGCGGGSGAASTASAPGAGAPEAQQQATTPSSTSPSSRLAQGKGSKSSSPTSPSSSGAGAGKQGPPVAAPGGGREQAPTQAEREQLTVADIALSSPALGSAEESPAALPARYTCDGEGRWPELRWRGVPTGTKELVLFAMNLQPVEGKLFFDWALAGLDPSLEGIEAGHLPKGAVTGTNSFGHDGYEICPEGSETYFFALLALPRALSPRQGFDPHALRDEALALSGNAGLLAVTYARG